MFDLGHVRNNVAAVNMQNNLNRTYQKDPDNRSLDDSEMLSEEIMTLWCGREG